MIIPYFGKLPDYFELWEKSASKNEIIDFYIFTDDKSFNSKYKNIYIKYLTFGELKRKIQDLFDFNIKLNSPYKLCDYKPTYGLVFNEIISNYDFWGYCDIDLIFGDLSKFITEEKLNIYDKFYYHGHFTLYRNNYEMNNLFYLIDKKYLDYKHAYATNLCCHFDESGVVSFSKKLGIKTYENWDFFDTYPSNYKYIKGSDSYFLWDNGKLLLNYDNIRKEVMYLHLQKRLMTNLINTDIEGINRFYIGYDLFTDDKKVVTDTLQYEIREKRFIRFWAKKKYIQKIKDIKLGLLKFKLISKINKWEYR